MDVNVSMDPMRIGTKFMTAPVGQGCRDASVPESAEEFEENAGSNWQ